MTAVTIIPMITPMSTFDVTFSRTFLRVEPDAFFSPDDMISIPKRYIESPPRTATTVKKIFIFSPSFWDGALLFAVILPYARISPCANRYAVPVFNPIFDK